MYTKSLGELKTLLNYSQDAFVISDHNGKIIYSNPALETVTGFKLDSHIGRNIRDLIKEKQITGSAALEAIELNKIVTKKVNTVSGKQVLSTASPVVDKNGRIHRVVCNLRDFTVLPKHDADEAALHPWILETTPTSYSSVKIGSADELIYCSKIIKSLLMAALKIAQADTTVIIYGETGTGKDLFARLIHYRSERSNEGPFVKVNCGAIPEKLIESELFGYEAGAFTGALKNGKIGYFELASGGTLFLDEIAELPLDLQAKLLGVLENKQIQKIGSTKTKTVDVRIVAATNRNLTKMIKDGIFREDLYYRLNVIPLTVPPLRERKEDIPALISFFTKRVKEKYNIHKEISPEMIHHLSFYPWPGNVREVSNLVERLAITSTHNLIHLSDLPDEYFHYSSSPIHFTIYNNGGPLKSMVDEFETAVISRILEQCHSQLEAAKTLGISIPTLTRKIRKLKARKKDRKPNIK